MRSREHGLSIGVQNLLRGALGDENLEHVMQTATKLQLGDEVGAQHGCSRGAAQVQHRLVCCLQIHNQHHAAHACSLIGKRRG